MSTYSSYKLELIGNGEQAGTWGTTTNNNLGSTSTSSRGIEQAIGGYAAITFSTTLYDLSTAGNYADTNGPQDFRALFLDCSGSPGAAATLRVPAIQKLYIIRNNVGYPITVKIASSTGTAVPNGQSMLVYATGSDVISPQNYFSAVTTPTLSVSGASTLTGAASVGGTLTASQNVAIGGTNIAVTGASYTVSGNNAAVVVSPALAAAFTAGDFVTADFTTGSGVDGRYQVAASPAPTTTTFTLVGAVPSGTTPGNINFYKSFRTTNTNDFYTSGSSGTAGQFLISQGTDIAPQWGNTTGSLTVGGTFTATGVSTFNNNTNIGAAEIVYTPASWTFSFTDTVTVTYNNHGFQNGDVVTIDFGTGTGTIPTTQNYTVANAATNTFTITFSGTSGSGSAATIYKASISFLNSQLYDDAESPGTAGQTLISQGANRPPLWSSPVALAGGGVNKIVVNTSSPNAIAAVAGTGSTTYPASFNRAFVNFDPRNNRQTVSGTYVWATTTLTVTSTAHGFLAGDIVWLYFTSGAAFSETYFYWYRISSVTTNTFTINTSTAAPGGASWSLSTTGNVQYFIINPSTLPSPTYSNVRRVCVGVYYGYNYSVENFNEYAILFNTAAPSTSYAWTGSSGNDIANSTSGYGNFISQPYYYASQKAFWKSTNYLLVGAYFDYNGPTSYTQSDISVVVTF